jgi:hypothetical protein
MSSSKQNNKLLVISITINICFAIVFSVGAYYKRDSIITRIRPYFRSSSNLEKEIAVMNPEPYIGKEEFINVTNSKNEITILVLGNSISLHGIVDGLWKYESGMAASSKEKDYVHVLVENISRTKKVGIKYIIVNIADFERNFGSFDFDRLTSLQNKNPQYIIFQIGENVSSTEITKHSDLFKQKYVSLINSFDNAIKIVCLPFWPDINKQVAITEVGIQTKSFIVDLSHLGNGIDEQNLAKSENKYSHTGVAAHPGDYGMNNIAMNIFSVFNAIIP